MKLAQESNHAPERADVVTSVVIPTFNRAQFVCEAIESALQQGSNVEVIIVDDGSTDNSWELISGYPAVRGFRTANRGVSAARNLGIDQALGTHIKFLDSDDLLPTNAVAALFHSIDQSKPKSIPVGTATVFGPDNPALASYGYSDVVGEGSIPGDILFRFTMPAILPLFPKAALVEVGGFNEELGIGEDYELTARLWAAGFQFIQTKVHACAIRNHFEPRLTRNYGAKGYQAHLLWLQTAWQTLDKLSAEEFSQASRIAIGQSAWTLAREASRERLMAEAKDLFAFARAAGGREAEAGSGLMKTLYKFMPPVTAEIIMDGAKSLTRRVG